MMQSQYDSREGSALLGGDSFDSQYRTPLQLPHPKEKSGRCLVRLPGPFYGMRLQPQFGGDTDFVEIDGHQPIEAISADWSSKLIGKDRVLCSAASVHFDKSNALGLLRWSAAAHGKIVVAMRGAASFEEIAKNAEASGALAVIVVDDRPVWKNNFSLTKDGGSTPRIPAVLVSKDYAHLLCSGCNGKQASISRRKSNLSKKQIARNVIAKALPFKIG
jgi:hypothetical protein